MSWNHSDKNLKVTCPECGSTNVHISTAYEWICDDCTTMGPELWGW